MTENKGQLLLAESSRDARRIRLTLWFASGVGWCVIVIILMYTGLRLLRGMPAVEALIMVILAIIYVTGGAYMVSRARNAQPLLLYEGGVENFRKGFRLRFKPIEEVQKVEINAAKGYVTIDIRTKGRFPPLNCMALENLSGEELRELVEFLRSKGVEITLRGKARERMP